MARANSDTEVFSRKEQPFFRSFREIRDQGELLRDRNPTLDEFVASEYLPYARETVKSWKTSEVMLRRYISPTFGQRRLCDVRRMEVQSWQNNMLKSGFSAGTVNRAFATLSAMYSYAELLGYIPFGLSPCYKLAKLPEARHEPYIAPPEKIAELIEALKQSDKIAAKAILLLIMTGARKKEILRAKWDDVDWETRKLRSPREVPGQQRYIDLSDDACAILNELKASSQSEWIFPGRNPDKPFYEIFPFWDKVRKAVGLAGMKIEDLRYNAIKY